MDLAIGATEIWQLAAVKLLFYLFIGLGLLFWFKFKKPILFVSLISFFVTGTYLILIYQSKLTWWGLNGDEIFVTAFLEKVASGQFFSDFFYNSLPPFYPPLYFWLIGGFGFIFGLAGIRLAQLGVTLVFLLVPFLVYFLQKQYWQKENQSSLKLVLAPALVFILADWTAPILKPYEFLSAVLIIFWTIFLLSDLAAKSLNFKKIIIYGITGGLLFLLYYFWFLPIALAIALFKLLTKTKASYYFIRLSLVAVLVILISLPYTLPLLFSYLKFGSENWQPGFFVPENLNLYLPFFQFSFFGLVSLIGLLAVIFYWSKPYIKILGAILAAAYLWQAINLITIIFWQVPFLPDKPFLFLAGAILPISAAYGISELIGQKIKNRPIQNGLFILGWIILATQLLGGTFIDNPKVQNQLVIMKQPAREEFVNLINQLKKIEDINQLTILPSGVPQISAYLPVNYYISYNIHFSHPAANFSKRYYFISNLASSVNPADFYNNLKQAPFGPIDALLLFKGPDFYPINFYLDNYPLGGIETEIRIPSHLIDERYFVKVFEGEYFVFLRIK